MIINVPVLKAEPSGSGLVFQHCFLILIPTEWQWQQSHCESANVAQLSNISSSQLALVIGK